MEFKLRNRRKYKILTATRSIVLGFLLIIFIGSGLLMLPCSTKGDGIKFIDALFTATSATCVTGLIVFPTSTTFSVFGQVIILLLVQTGGLGFMALTSFIYLIFSRRVSLSSRLTLKEDIADGNIHYIKRVITRILALTFITELLGAIVLSGAFSRYMPAGDAIWYGIFHSVSAFCNAGFDIVNANFGSSLTHFYSDPLIILTISFLIIIGGIGFLVVSDIWDHKRWRKFRLHTKIVLIVTFSLISLGTIFFLAVEYKNPNTFGNMNFGEKLLNAYFQSVTARTAGFNTIEIANLTPASHIMLDTLMFIGASPGSTGGGIKTTTLFVLIVMVISVVRQKRYAIVDKQTIGMNTTFKATAIFALAMFIMVVSTCILLISENGKFTFNQVLFEQISAYATVGLSQGITAKLSTIGKLVIMLSMFLGRVGALTFFIAFKRSKKQKDGKIQYPECSLNL